MSRVLTAITSVLILVLGLSTVVEAKRNHRGFYIGDQPRKEQSNQPEYNQYQPKVSSEDDIQIVNAINNRKRTRFVEGKKLKVVQLLPDDTKGSPHQKFVVELSSKDKIQIISNTDMCPQVPVRIGDEVGVGGEFIPTGKRSGLIHWVHWDPRKTRPDGYIEHNGQIYCKKN